MARIDKIKEKVKADSENFQKSETIILLEHLGFGFERHTKHTTFHTFDEHAIALDRHKDIRHPGGTKDLRNFLEDLLEEELNHNIVLGKNYGKEYQLLLEFTLHHRTAARS